MKNILILGASGQIAQWVVRSLAEVPTVSQTLLLRDPKKLSGKEPANASIVIGDVLDTQLLKEVMAGHDLVYANLTGDDIDQQAEAVIAAMKAAAVQRLVFVLALGIYDEVPGPFGVWNQATIGEELKPFRRAADAIEASGLDFTILRPAWLTDEDDVDYELTPKGAPFKGTVVSRRSVAHLIVKLITEPEIHRAESLGVNKPGSEGDKPYFM